VHALSWREVDFPGVLVAGLIVVSAPRIVHGGA
jgi:hypothetical protein